MWIYLNMHFIFDEAMNQPMQISSQKIVKPHRIVVIIKSIRSSHTKGINQR